MMLLQFNFKNFKSFRDEACLDLTAAPISENRESLMTSGNEKVLPIAAVFGANASGKSNVLAAFDFMSEYVIRSLSYGDEEPEEDKEALIRHQPFLFDGTREARPSSFEVFVTIPGDPKERVYQYGFTLGKTGILEEWLNYKPKSARDKYNCIFYRNEETGALDLSGLPAEARANIKTALGRETLAVSLGAKLQVDILKDVRTWFVRNSVIDFGNPANNLKYSKQMPKGFATDEKIQAEMVKFLSSFDPSIIGFEVEPLQRGESKPEGYRIFALHNSCDSETIVGLTLSQESAGTQKMFSLYSRLRPVLDRGGVLMIDELNARLHPLLVRNIIIAFLNPELNRNQAQFIFTSHDTWLLESGLLRRDEIWFTEKDESGVSSLYSLVEFEDQAGNKIRKDENFEKNYLLGKYGAVPVLKNILTPEVGSDG